MADEQRDLFPEQPSLSPSVIPAHDATYLDYNRENASSKRLYAAVAAAMLVFALVGGYFTMKFFTSGDSRTSGATVATPVQNSDNTLVPPQAPEGTSPSPFTFNPSLSTTSSLPLLPGVTTASVSMPPASNVPGLPGLPSQQPSNPGVPSHPVPPTSHPSTPPTAPPTVPTTTPPPTPVPDPLVMSFSERRTVSGAGSVPTLHEGNLVTGIRSTPKRNLLSRSQAQMITSVGDLPLEVSDGRSATVGLDLLVDLGHTPPVQISVLQLSSSSLFGFTALPSLRIDKGQWVVYGGDLTTLTAQPISPTTLPFLTGQTVHIDLEFSLVNGQLASLLTLNGQELSRTISPWVGSTVRLMTGLSTRTGEEGSSAVNAVYHFTTARVTNI